VSSESGHEHTRAWSGRRLSETKGDYDEGQGDHEAVRRKALARQQKRGTDLKMKRQIRPRSKCKGHECNSTWAASLAYK
jgi:hypothetical protein